MQKLHGKRDSVILARGWLAPSAVGHRDVVASHSPDWSALAGEMEMASAGVPYLEEGHGHNHMESHVIFKGEGGHPLIPSAMHDAGGW
jgi:hypothetical protein